MVANTKQSYDVTIECMIMGTTTKSTNSLDLKNPYFRYTGVQPPPPPGQDNQSPSEAYWSQVDMQGARQVSIDTGGLFSVCQKLKRILICLNLFDIPGAPVGIRTWGLVLLTLKCFYLYSNYEGYKRVTKGTLRKSFTLQEIKGRVGF